MRFVMRQHGLSLIELMVVVTIIAVLALQAIPALGSYLANSRLRESANTVVTTALFTRSEAIKRNRNLSLVSDGVTLTVTQVVGTAAGKGPVRESTPVPSAGAGLVEGLVAIVVLSFGMLGLARMQVKLVSQTTDAQARLAATTLTEDLLTQLQVDLANSNCCTLPQAGTRGSDFAKSQAEDWKARATTDLPGYRNAVAAISSTNTFTVKLSRDSKSFKLADGTPEVRSRRVSTDVRP